MAVSAFRGAIEFFDKLGVYDVVLPFLLIFTIVFAILEKTKFFGTEKVGDKEYTKKNLDAMFAFVVALLVVASSQIVGIINRGLAQVGLMIVISVSFLILVGTFYGKDEVKLSGGWRTGGMIVMLIAIILIFVNQAGWLSPFWDYLTSNFDSTVVGSIALIILIVAFMIYIGKENTPVKPEDKEKEERG